MTDRYVIWSFEHGAWWGPKRWGYTPSLAQAGRYSREEAERIVAHANIVRRNEHCLPLAEAEADEQRNGPLAERVGNLWLFDMLTGGAE